MIKILKRIRIVQLIIGKPLWLMLLITILFFCKEKCNAQQPNVLLIISDDQGIGDFGFMGNKMVKTPNLDRLAEQSAVFKNFVVAPACSPTRSSLMTGRNHLKAGVWGVGARNNLMRDETLMPEYFKAAGYGTGYFGKRDGVYLLEKQAWDWGFDEASHVLGYKHKDATSLTDKGNVNRTGWTCDVDVDTSLDYIKRQGDNPWFCTTAFILPHLPWIPDDRFAKPYRDEGCSKLLADFYGCVTQLDDAIGRLLKGLEDLGQAENTIVLFLSDNGPSYKNMSEQDIQSRNPLGLKGTKSTAWENGIVVPFMARWPKNIQPGERTQFATVEDLVPTLIDLTGMQNKLPVHLPFDGVSLRTALLDPQAQSIDRQVLRVAISAEGAAGGTNNGKRGIVNDPQKVTIDEQHLILRGERFKYHNFADGTTALYDIVADSGENHDIRDEYSQIADQYKKELERQYSNFINTGRVFRMPVAKIGENGFGANGLTGAMANKAFGYNETLQFHFLKGFTKANDGAEYKVIVDKTGVYDVTVMGQDLSPDKSWELLHDNASYTPEKADEKRMTFESVKFLKPGEQLFTLKVNKDGTSSKIPVVEHIKFNPKTKNQGAAQWDELETSSEERFVMKDWMYSDPQLIKDMGVMDNFYKHTQLQGHLVEGGLNLDKVPAYWCDGSDFPYKKKASEKEVFFVDDFSITRFLGGYPQRWNHDKNALPTNDLAYLDENGKLQYRLDLVKPRLQQYINNAYTNFIIGIENVPWAMAREKLASGPYGQTSPPRDWDEWYDFIKAVCLEMKSVYPKEVVKNLSFKIGNEYNQKKLFTGTHEDFLKLYDYSAAAILSVFPKAEIMPGEIGGAASAPDNAVDYIKLYDHFVSGKNYAGTDALSPVSVLPRSTHSFPNSMDLSPRDRLEFSNSSFEVVLKDKPNDFVSELSLEYHQYGVLGSALDSKINDVGSRAASWQFQTMFRAKAGNYLNKCWSWDKAERIRASSDTTFILNSIGCLYSVLEHLQGDNMYLLGSLQPENSERDVTTVAFINNDRLVLVVSSWSKDIDATTPMPVKLQIPKEKLPFALNMKEASALSFTDGNSVYQTIKADLSKANNLNSEFENTALLSSLRSMAKEQNKGSLMVLKNIEKYQRIQQNNLTLKPLKAGKVSMTSPSRANYSELTVNLLPNELYVLVFKR